MNDNQSSHNQGNSNYGNQSTDRDYNNPYEGQKLSGDPMALTLGIVSLVCFCIFCWCYGVIAIITLVMSIIGLVVANRSIREYQSDPDKYSENSLKSVKNGRVLNIITVVLSSIVTLALIVLAIFFGSVFYAIMNGDLDGWKNFDKYNETIYEDENIRIEENTDVWEYNEEVDSLNQTQDSLKQKVDSDKVIIEDVE